MSFTRASVIRGPAQIKYTGPNGLQVYYSQGDVKLNVGFETFPIVVSAVGEVAHHVRQRVATVSFTPWGDIVPLNSAPEIYAFGSKRAGDPLLDGTTDYSLVIQSYAAGYEKATVYNVGQTKIPDLILSATKTLFGEVVFTGLGTLNLTRTPTAGTFVKLESGTQPTDVFPAAGVPTEFYTANWGSNVNWQGLQTVAGWHLTFDLGLTPVSIDSYGIIDWTVGEVHASARAQIVGLSEADFIGSTINDYPAKALPVDVLVGSEVSSQNTLVLTGSQLVATLNNTKIKMVPIQYGMNQLRIADCEFTATRKASNGTTVSALFSVLHA